MRAALAEAEAVHQLKQVSLERAAKLRAGNQVSDVEVSEHEAGVRVAEARMQAARHVLERTRVVAPIDGVVSDLPARPGMLVKNDSVLATLLDTTALSLIAHVPQQLIPRLKPGQAVQVILDALPDDTFEGSIASVSPTVQSATGTVRVTVRLADTQGKVRPGMGGWVQFEGGK